MKKDISKKQEILDLHEQKRGKLTISSTVEINSREILSQVYSPGVGEVVKEIEANPKLLRKYTIAGKTVAVISNGTAVLGYGNVGAKAALPVMEGKCAIFKEFAGIDAFPICIEEKNPQKFINIVKSLAMNFAGINLEDISAPDCFLIEDTLKEELDIPVVHDDQHGTAIVTLSGLLGANALRKKRINKIIIVGAGAAGIATTKLLLLARTNGVLDFKEIGVIDSVGLVSKDRTDLNIYKKDLAKITNQETSQSLKKYIVGADIFIGLSKADILTPELLRTMSEDPIIFALANPHPEIVPELANENGALIVATGRSDYPNQVNNALAYPGMFKGAIKKGLVKITDINKLKVAQAIYNYHKDNLSIDKILPDILDHEVVNVVAEWI